MMWKVAQCAVQGRSHIKNDIPCQDKTYFIIKDDTVVSALADGAGSAKLSHYGAERITKFICEDMSKNFDSYFNNDDGVLVKTELDAKIKNEIDNLSAELGCNSNDLASTLLSIAISGDRYILFHIGDGVVGYSKNKMLNVASQPENGEFANTTVFTTSKDSILSMRLMKGNLGKIDGFILMSDGSEASLYNKREKKLAEVLHRIMGMLSFVPPHRVEQRLNESFLSVVRNATVDDCSILVMSNLKEDTFGYMHLDEAFKKDFFTIKNGLRSKKQLRRLDDLIITISKPMTLKCIAQRVHIKPKYIRRYISKLMEIGLIEKEGNMYYRTIVM